ncbi:MAG: carboxylesterase family protein [Acidimicrobiia bacterium]|nr:carboxylesterase family protein [Acidimicrobiia bacterium]
MVSVTTSLGRLEGIGLEGPHGPDVAGVVAFLGVPYAAPPVGERRFRPPEPPEQWTGTRPATAFGPSCLQPDPSTSPAHRLIEFSYPDQGEDCLTLNIWTPACDGAARAVMVFLHGGAFVTGSGSQAIYGGAELARRGDVVVVNVNYRLGVFGWLHAPAIGADGNAGLHDQLAALRWVRHEIAAFGGDPDRLTVFGESAGAFCISAMLAGAATVAGERPFRRAIMQSGATTTRSLDEAVDVTGRITAHLGLGASELDRLRDLPAIELLAAQEAATPRSAGVLYRPVADDQLVRADQLGALTDGSASGVDLVIGTNAEEMGFFVGLDPRTDALDDPGLVRAVAHLVDDDRARATHLIDAYRRARDERGEPTGHRALWYAIGGDARFRRDSVAVAEAQRRHGRTYQYLFDWRSPLFEGRIGAAHVLEVPFVTGTTEHPSVAGYVGDAPGRAELSTAMIEAWTSFARTGRPAATHLPDWPETGAAHHTMRLGGDSRLETAPAHAELAAWSTES